MSRRMKGERISMRRCKVLLIIYLSSQHLSNTHHHVRCEKVQDGLTIQQCTFALALHKYINNTNNKNMHHLAMEQHISLAKDCCYYCLTFALINLINRLNCFTASIRAT